MSISEGEVLEETKEEVVPAVLSLLRRQSFLDIRRPIQAIMPTIDTSPIRHTPNAARAQKIANSRGPIFIALQRLARCQ
jgi:hypothetical protein